MTPTPSPDSLILFNFMLFSFLTPGTLIVISDQCFQFITPPPHPHYSSSVLWFPHVEMVVPSVIPTVRLYEVRRRYPVILMLMVK